MEKNDVMTLKLVTGEELLVKYDSETSDHILFIKPMVAEYTAQGFILYPYLMTAKQGEVLSLEKNKVLISCITESDIATAYIEKTTGLTLVK